MERLERDVDEWRHLSNSDLDPSVNEQLEHLTTQMREARLAAQEAAEAISSDLKFLETRKVEIRDAIDTSIVLFLMLRIRLKRPRK